MEAMSLFSHSRLPTLDSDAWRALLDCLETRDLVRLEGVSREWRDAVHTYLQHVHGFAIVKETNNDAEKYRLIHLSDPELMRAMFRNIGRYMARIATDGGKEWVQAIAANCPGLRQITLLNVSEDSNEELLILWRRCIALEKVTFRSSKWVDDSFTFYLQHLRHLEIDQNERITGSFLNTISRGLETMSLKACTELKSGQFQRNVDKLANITKLELDDCPTIFEEVHQILGATPQLQELSLSHYRGNYDQSKIEELAVAISRLSLRILRLRRNGAVDDRFLEIVAQGCAGLETLELPGCNGNYYHAGVSEAGVAALASCRRLRLLDLSSCGALTSPGLSSLASCPQLETLSLRRNEGIKERAFFLVVKACPNLRVLDARGCAAATSRLVQEIAKLAAARRHALALRLAATSVRQQDINEVVSKSAGKLQVTLGGAEKEPWENQYSFMRDAGVYENYPDIPAWQGHGGNHWGIMEVDNNQ